MPLCLLLSFVLTSPSFHLDSRHCTQYFLPSTSSLTCKCLLPYFSIILTFPIPSSFRVSPLPFLSITSRYTIFSAFHLFLNFLLNASRLISPFFSCFLFHLSSFSLLCVLVSITSRYTIFPSFHLFLNFLLNASCLISPFFSCFLFHLSFLFHSPPQFSHLHTFLLFRNFPIIVCLCTSS